TATLNAAFNTQNTVQIKDILPDQNGGVTIQVKASPNSTFAYINGLIIQAATPSHSGGAAARTRSFADNGPEAESSLEVSLEDAVLAYPNPFTDQITITSQYKAKIADVSLIDALGSATRIAATPGSDGAVYLE